MLAQYETFNTRALPRPSDKDSLVIYTSSASSVLVLWMSSCKCANSVSRIRIWTPLSRPMISDKAAGIRSLERSSLRLA